MEALSCSAWVLRVPTIKIRYEDENRVRARDLYIVSASQPLYKLIAVSLPPYGGTAKHG